VDWRSAFASLAPTLLPHFEAEEAPNGFCDRVARHVSPARARDLRRDHRELLRWLDALRSLDGSRFEKTVRAFADRLAAHEQIEAELALRCARIGG
jgi:hypothetical protein